MHTFHPPVNVTQASAAQSPAGGSATATISANVLQQIGTLTSQKRSRTASQKKISSTLVNTAKMLAGQQVANAVPYLQTGVQLDDTNNLFVKISADVTDLLLARLSSAGVQVVQAIPRYHSIQALVPPPQLEQIAGWSEVRFIGPVYRNLTNSVPITEGDVTHKANLARGTFGTNGAGVKIGVLSDGVTHLSESQALGALGPVTVLPDQAGAGDEGTAMLEIVHTLAPGASLSFATGGMFGSETLAQNILALRAAGCDIIVDDLSGPWETPFQDGQAVSVNSPWNGGIVTQAINDVVADGALYFTSAGNSGNSDSQRPNYVETTGSGTYEGDFADSGVDLLVDGVAKGRMHAFDMTATPPALLNRITSNTTIVTLHWADPLGTSSNDYDLYLIDPTGTMVVGESVDVQDGANDPFEVIGSDTSLINCSIIVVKYSGEDRFLHVSTSRGRLFYGTQGASYGHSAARQAFSVAATPAYQPQLAEYPLGPYPGPFSLVNLIEPFSSDGPRRLFFQADGTPFTPSDFSSTGGAALPKPDITAADGVSVTGVGGFPVPFYGTSAAAPHAAAIAALIKSAKAGIGNAEIASALRNSSIDLTPTGWDRDAGTGIVMAYEAVSSIGTQGTLGAPTNVSATAGNTTATVSFTAPATGSDITSYTATSSPGGITATGPVSPITVTGLTNGTTYTFKVTASNSTGTGPASAPSNLVTPLPDTAPALAISTLADGTVTKDAAVTITGSASSGNGIKSLSVNGTAVTVNANGSFSTGLTLHEGVNIISTVVTDRADMQRADTRTIVVDTTAPAVSVSPSDRSSLNQTAVTISGSASDANLSTVSATVDASPQPLTVASGSFSATVQLAAGSHTYEITATDLAGNSTVVRRNLTVDVAKPGLSVTDPAQDITVHRSNYLLKGKASSSATRVAITAGSTSYTPALASDGTFQQVISFNAESSFLVTVVATDSAGNQSSVQRNVVYTLAKTGDINGDGEVNVGDVVLALQIAIGNRKPTQEQLSRGDVAPVVSGSPHPDGVIDIGDAIVILRKSVGLLNW